MGDYKWTEKAIEKILCNPFYAINISTNLFAEHEALVDKESWIKANALLIKEIGAEKWLVKLLSVLEGNFV